MNEDKRRSNIRKLVANARAIISYQVGLPVGCEKMDRIYRWLEYNGGWGDRHPVFYRYAEATSHLPTSSERLHCSREALRRYDEDLVAVNLAFREEVIDVCFDIIDKYGERAAGGT